MSRGGRRLRNGWITLLMLLALASPALGQKLTPQQVEQARNHYKAAVAAEKAGDFDGAVKEFDAAYEITKDPKLFYQIGRVHEAAGHTQEALDFYRLYLKEAQVSSEGKMEVEGKIAALEAKAGGGTLMPLEPPASQPASQPGEPTEPASQPFEPALVGDGVTVEKLPEAPPRPTTWRNTAAWASVGLAAAFLTTGGVLATTGLSRESDIKRLQSHADPATGLPSTYTGDVQAQYADATDEGKTYETWATVAFAGAGAAAIAATVFFVLESKAERGPAAAAPASARISPYLGPDGAGVAAAWEF